jgi:hypothetical protein
MISANGWMHGLKSGIWRNNLPLASGFRGLEDCRRGKGRDGPQGRLILSIEIGRDGLCPT